MRVGSRPGMSARSWETRADGPVAEFDESERRGGRTRPTARGGQIASQGAADGIPRLGLGQRPTRSPGSCRLDLARRVWECLPVSRLRRLGSLRQRGNKGSAGRSPRPGSASRDEVDRQGGRTPAQAARRAGRGRRVDLVGRSRRGGVVTRMLEGWCRVVLNRRGCADHDKAPALALGSEWTQSPEPVSLP